MKDIKMKEIKKEIKTLDKSRAISERMKNTVAQTKVKSNQEVAENENSLNEYASDRVEQAFIRVKDKAIYEFNKQGQKGLEDTKQYISKARDYFRNRKNNGYINSEPKSSSGARSTENHVSKLIKQPSHSLKKMTAKMADKHTIKTTQKSVKTAEKTSKAAIKTTQKSSKAAQKTAQATVKVSQRAAQAAHAAAKATVTTIKAAAKATIAAVKAIIAGTKALVAAIAAGGWVAVVIIVVICLIALIVGSCFGIFFASEDTGSDMSLQQAVREIDEDYQNQLETIKAKNHYDNLEMSGSRVVWPQVLSVYAVKTTTELNNSMEVVTMTEEKKRLLTNIFWEMNDISHRTETKTETVIVESDDGQGNILEEKVEKIRTTLYIVVRHKDANDMAIQYDFNDDQKEQLEELLNADDSMWPTVLYGIYSSDNFIVQVAIMQKGNIGGEPYWSWYGFDSRVEWCACFVSWCAEQCGYIENGIIPKYAGCITGVQWFKDRGQWADKTIEPAPGMIIFFDWDNPNGSSGPQDGLSDHTGIVERIEDGWVYTIEGNSGDSCRECKYRIGDHEILGYGIPAY